MSESIQCPGPAGLWPCDLMIGHGGKHIRTLEARFWRRVNKNGPIVRPELGPCWIWTGATVNKGYGHINRGRGRGWIRAHRLALELAGRPVAPGRMALHRCDNPPCVNEAHLFEGTNADNMQDCSRKGRLKTALPDNSGERNGQAKLTTVKVLWIRAQVAAGRSQADIARELGLSSATVSDANSGKRLWRNVVEPTGGTK